MSLREAYTLAHTAQCRLQMEANRPDRNLRFVVGHLMHYESLRLRIVEIEHDISTAQRARTDESQGAEHMEHTLQHKPSTGQLGRRSPPPPTYKQEEDEEDDIDDFLDDEDDAAGLSLERFPSGSTRPPIVPDLEPDDADDDEEEDEDELASPADPSMEMIEESIKGKTNELVAKMYEGVRDCTCHGKTDAPSFERIWDLPSDQAHSKDGVTRALAQVGEKAEVAAVAA